MSEQYWADRLSDSLEKSSGFRPSQQAEALPQDFVDALDLATTLASTDLTAQSRVRGTLRRKILQLELHANASNPQKAALPRVAKHPALRRRLSWAVSGALALLLAVLLLSPGGPASAAQNISNGAKLIVLGAYTIVQKVESFVTGEPIPDDEWSLKLFPGFGIGGNGLPGTNPVVQSVVSFEEAQAAVKFQLKWPNQLPPGYQPQTITLAPVWTGAGALLLPQNPNVFITFDGPSGLIVVGQQPVGPIDGGLSGSAIGQFIGYAFSGSVEELEVNGRPAIWAEGNLLIWENAGVSFLVGGPDLSLQTAMQIARSLK